jgi:hypothetical protein
MIRKTTAKKERSQSSARLINFRELLGVSIPIDIFFNFVSSDGFIPTRL